MENIITLDENCLKGDIRIRQKYPDKLIRATKKCLFDTIMDYLNFIINKLNGKASFSKYNKLLKINYEQIRNVTANFNQDLLKTLVKEIFSVDITGKYTIYMKEHNRDLINECLNNTNQEKRKIFEIIFNKTLLEYIKLISRREEIKDLEGLVDIFQINLSKMNEYKKEIIFQIITDDYESLFSEKKKSKKKKKYLNK